jgi:hypothetical protein
MTSEACVAIILALECSPEKAKKRKLKPYWMKEWFKKRITFSNQNILQELLLSSQVDYNNFMRMEHSTFLELFHIVTCKVTVDGVLD